MDPSCLSRVQARFNIELHPSKLQDVREGVREHFNNILFRYQDDLEGFVMAYDTVKVLSKKGTIHPYFPLVRLEVLARVLLFKPAVGSMLVGRVIKVGADFIGLLVMGIFNASIAAESIRTDLKCDTSTDTWTSSRDPDHSITLGSEVRFQVVKMQDQAVFFGIFGALMDKNTGAVDYLIKKGRLTDGGKENGLKGKAAAAEENGNAEKSSKKRKKDKEKEGRANGLAVTPLTEGKPSKKSKKDEAGKSTEKKKKKSRSDE